MSRKEQFYSLYKHYTMRKLFKDYTIRAKYKEWTNWCFRRSGNGLYYFDKGYDEDYVGKMVII